MPYSLNCEKLYFADVCRLSDDLSFDTTEV